MKSTLLLVLILSFISCNKNDPSQDCETSVSQNQEDGTSTSTVCDSTEQDDQNQQPEPEPTPTPEDPSDVPEVTQFDADVQTFYFSDSGEAKVAKAVTIIKKVVQSQEFRDRVLNYTYNGKKQFVDNEGKSNAQIYQEILDASEELNPGKNQRMDLEVEYYYNGWTSTVGYTYPDSMRIYVNGKFFNSYTPAEVAGNLFHEWTHKLGYGHDSSYSESRDHSVPYALGYIMEELGFQYE